MLEAGRDKPPLAPLPDWLSMWCWFMFMPILGEGAWPCGGC